MEEVDYGEEEAHQSHRTAPRFQHRVATESSSRDEGMRTKGRGHGANLESSEIGSYEGFDDEEGHRHGPAKSVEGYIVFVRNVHPEAQEDDLVDKFQDFGDVKNINMNLDRRTGFVKGYALVEYETYDEANRAIREMNGQDLMGQPVTVDWCFIKK